MSPNYQYNWPAWPEVDRNTLDAVAVATYSRRWAIATKADRGGSRIDRVESKLATLLGRSFCVTACNGATAITIALQALGIGPGDRVLLPALTWVGCATSILRVGAIPVFADSGENTPLMEVTEQQRSKLGRIDAILVVHLYASQMSVEALQQSFPGVPIIEDCSHCQGARDASGRLLGQHGEIAIYSLQSKKILSCGEGGAALTDSLELAQRLAALRADSRIRPQQNDPLRELDLEPYTLVHGANLALSEIAAGLLLDQMARFPAQLQRRAQGIEEFLAVAQEVGLTVMGDRPSFESGAFYGVMVHLTEGIFAQEASRKEFIRQLHQQCRIVLSPVYPPIPQCPMYQPASMKQYAKLATADFDITHAERWHRSAVVIPHWAFLASSSALAGLAYALADLTFDRIQPKSMAVPKRETFKPETNSTNIPEITVVIVTNSQRPSLQQTLASVIAQDYPGKVKVLLVRDESSSNSGTPLPYLEQFPNVKEVVICAQDLFQNYPVVARVSRLQNIALEFVDSPLVCFLDDDNTWETNHLSSLWQTMTEHRVPAVYSNQNNSLVQDEGSLPVENKDFAKVDIGAWLLDAALVRQLRFPTSDSEQEPAEMWGKDGKFLWRLQELGVGTACTNQPTCHLQHNLA